MPKLSFREFCSIVDTSPGAIIEYLGTFWNPSSLICHKQGETYICEDIPEDWTEELNKLKLGDERGKE